MTKEQAAEILNAKGYHAQVINGVVEISTPDRNDYDKIKRIFKKAGYNQSYGWKKEYSTEENRKGVVPDSALGLCPARCNDAKGD